MALLVVRIPNLTSPNSHTKSAHRHTCLSSRLHNLSVVVRQLLLPPLLRRYTPDLAAVSSREIWKRVTWPTRMTTETVALPRYWILYNSNHNSTRTMICHYNCWLLCIRLLLPANFDLVLAAVFKTNFKFTCST